MRRYFSNKCVACSRTTTLTRLAREYMGARGIGYHCLFERRRSRVYCVYDSFFNLKELSVFSSLTV